MKKNSEIKTFLDRYLITVSKPGRYTGGEFNQIIKDWQSTEVHVCLSFPDIYDIGLPNLGMSILYETINKREDSLAERAYSPWTDMEDLLRSHDMPLFSLESKTPLNEFDIVGFTLPYETLYTNLLNMLDLGGIPIHSSERNENDPLIIAGGHACFNPEPMHAFVDAFTIGEGEEIIHEIIDVTKEAIKAGLSRADLLGILAELPGVYVPSHFEVQYDDSGLIENIQNTVDPQKNSIIKRFARKLPPPYTNFLVPNIKTVNERVVVEVMRGCSRGCRFCQAGMITRPVRERSVDETVHAIEEALAATGFEEVSLLSLSTSDHSRIREIIDKVMELNKDIQFTFSLPSLRVESFDSVLIESMKGKRKGNFTIAPEAGSDSLRSRINKTMNREEILSTAADIFKMGWTNLKLYFMIGFPGETLDDIQGIIDLSKEIKAIGKRMVGGRAKIHLSVNTLIPKAHTPFQWNAFSENEDLLEKYRLINDDLKKSKIKVDWPDYKNALLEAWLSRGDRQLSGVIEAAWHNGARFDAWRECFNLDNWLKAFSDLEIDPDFYSTRQRSTDEIMPWDHINPGITKKFLLREYQNSLDSDVTPDCREVCHACGIQTRYAISCSKIRLGD